MQNLGEKIGALWEMYKWRMVNLYSGFTLWNLVEYGQ